MDEQEMVQPLVWEGKDEELEEGWARSLWVHFAPVSLCNVLKAKAQEEEKKRQSKKEDWRCKEKWMEQGPGEMGGETRKDTDGGWRREARRRAPKEYEIATEVSKCDEGLHGFP